MVPIQLYDPMKETYHIYTDSYGSEIEQELIEEYQDWLTIRVHDCWENNCELMYIFDQVTKH